MNARAARLAWSLWTLIMGVAAASLVLRFLNGSAATASLEGLALVLEIFWWDVLIPAAMPAFATVGAVVASRRPENAVGWLCLAVGGLIAVVEATWEYAARALEVAPGSLPAGTLAAWVADVVNLTVLMPFALILLLFPDGSLPSRRWRLVVYVALAGAALRALSGALGPSIEVGLEGDGGIRNPTAVEGLGAFVRVAEQGWFPALLGALLASVVSVFLRWRRSGGVERQQVKWLAYVGAIIAAALLGGIASGYVSGLSLATFLVASVGIAGITVGVPVAMGVAILRHRLYDLDLLINRTLVYVLLTAALLTTYLGGVAFLQWTFRALGGGTSQLAIVASTLTIAALFSPLRRGIQSFIDRRFYRKKYDARETLEVFSARLRNETDLDRLGDDLVKAVRETMQPAHASLWLREPEQRRRVDVTPPVGDPRT